MMLANLYLVLLCGVFLIIGCATPEERRVRQEQKDMRMKALSDTIKFYDYDDKQRCDINRQCQFVMSYACWAKPEVFEKRCKQKILKVIEKYGGDTYLYSAKPIIENTGLLFAQSDIFKCSAGAYQAPERIQKAFEKKEKYQIYRVRFVPADYNIQCNLLDTCQPVGKFKCSSSRSNGLLQCHKYLQRYLPKSHPTYMIENEDTTGNYKVSGEVYSCPKNLLSALPELKQRVYNKSSEFEPDDIDLGVDFSKIASFQSAGDITIINAQQSKDVVSYRRRSGYFINLHDPSEQMTRILVREMGKRGVNVVDGAVKTLSISIDRVEAHSASDLERNVITYSITPGNAKRLIRIKESESEGDFNTVLNKTLAEIAKDIMNNENVRDYIEK